MPSKDGIIHVYIQLLKQSNMMLNNDLNKLLKYICLLKNEYEYQDEISSNVS